LYKNHGTADVPAQTWANNKVAIGAEDLRVEAKASGAAFQLNPRHPQRSVTAMRLITAATNKAREAITMALYQAYWVDNQDINDEAVLNAIAQRHGLSLADAQAQPVKDLLRANTRAASDRGVFGVPSFEIEGKLWWGQDRMHLVEKALGGQPSYFPELPPTPGGVIDFYHDFSSPYSYLAATQIQGLAQAAGAQINFKPILLGALFKAIGTANIPIFTFGEARQTYTMRDLHDWADWWGVDFNFAPHFPMRTVTAGRVAIIKPTTTLDIYRAAWVDGVDLNDEEALAAALSLAGHDGEALVAGTTNPKIKAGLRANTEAAVALGACGAPTMVVNSKVFWGQDRLHRMMAALGV
jgi:2-hydroxychromene-2-carboxylate isomerase